MGRRAGVGRQTLESHPSPQTRKSPSNTQELFVYFKNSQLTLRFDA